VSTAPLKRASAYSECDFDEPLQPFAELHMNHEVMSSVADLIDAKDNQSGTDDLPNKITANLPEPKAKARFTVKDFKKFRQ
jgi:hypothetical protein